MMFPALPMLDMTRVLRLNGDLITEHLAASARGKRDLNQQGIPEGTPGSGDLISETDE